MGVLSILMDRCRFAGITSLRGSGVEPGFYPRVPVAAGVCFFQIAHNNGFHAGKPGQTGKGNKNGR